MNSNKQPLQQILEQADIIGDILKSVMAILKEEDIETIDGLTGIGNEIDSWKLKPFVRRKLQTIIQNNKEGKYNIALPPTEVPSQQTDPQTLEPIYQVILDAGLSREKFDLFKNFFKEWEIENLEDFLASSEYLSETELLQDEIEKLKQKIEQILKPSEVTEDMKKDTNESPQKDPIQKKEEDPDIKQSSSSQVEIQGLNSLNDENEELKVQNKQKQNSNEEEEEKEQSQQYQINNEVIQQIERKRDPSQQEQISTDKTHANKMPDCTEKFLNLIQINLQLLQNKPEIEANNEQLKSQTSDMLEKLEENLKIEEQLEEPEVQKALQKLKQSFKNQDFVQASGCNLSIYNFLYQINIKRLLELINLNNDARTMVKNKDIIMFLGDTGTGKSTTIHFLADSKMRRVKINGIEHIEPDPNSIKIKQLESVKTSPFSTSETRYITPVEIDLHSRSIRIKDTKYISLCDSPGFKDTSGPEVDIANAFGVYEAIQGCKSLRVVILISKLTVGDRGSYVKDLSHLLTRMIDNIQDYLGCFTYIFTKYNADEQQQLHARMKNILDVYYKQVEKKETPVDESFAAVMGSIVDQTGDSPILIDPFKSIADQILKKIVSTIPIKDFSDFKYTVAELSQNQLIEQIRKLQISVTRNLKYQRYDVIKYYLDQVEELNKFLKIEEVSRIFQDIRRSILESLNKIYDDSIEKLNQRFDEGNTPNQNDIENYCRSLSITKSSQCLLDSHLKDQQVPQVQSYVNNFLQLYKDQALRILSSKEFIVEEILQRIQKLSLLKNNFNLLEIDQELDRLNYYRQSSEYIENFFQEKRKEFEEEYKTNYFQTSTEKFQFLVKILKTLGIHFLKSQENVAKQEESVVSSAKNFVNYQFQKSIDIIQLKNWKEKDIESIHLNFKICKGLINSDFHYIVKRDLLELKQQELFEALIGAADLRLRGVMARLEEEGVIRFDEIENIFEEIDRLGKEQELNEKINIYFYQMRDSVGQKIVSLANDAKRILIEVMANRDRVNYKPFRQHLSSLENTRWFAKYNPNSYKNVIGQIQQQISDHLQELNQEIEDIINDLENGNNLEVTYKIIKKIRNIELQFKSIMRDDVEKPQESNSQFQEQVIIILSKFDENIKMILKSYQDFLDQNYNKQQEESKQQVQRPSKLTIFTKVIKGREFLQLCDKQKLDQSYNHRIILSNLNEFLIYLQQEFILQIEDINKKIRSLNFQGLEQQIQIISNNLEIMRPLSAKYQDFYIEFLRDIDLKYIEILNGIYKYIEAEIDNQMQHEQIDISIKLVNLAKDLIIFDKYNIDRKYYDLSSTQGAKIKENLNDEEKKVRDFLDNKQYDELYNQLEQVQGKEDILLKRTFEKIINTINRFINEKKQDIKRQCGIICVGIFESKEIFEKISTNIQSLPPKDHPINLILIGQQGQSKYMVASQIQNNEQKQQPLQIQDQIIQDIKKQIIEGLVEKLKTAQQKFQNLRFDEGIAIVQMIKQIETLLSLDCAFQFKDSQNYQETFKQTQEQKERVFENQLNIFKQLTIDVIFNNPPKRFFDNFSNQKNQNEAFLYQEKLVQLMQQIKVRMVMEVEKLNDIKGQREKDLFKKRLYSATELLPDGLKDQVKLEIEAAVARFEQIIIDNKEDFELASRNRNYTKLKQLFKLFSENKIRQYENQISEIFIKEAERQQKSIQSKFAIQTDLTIVKDIGEFYRFYQEFKDPFEIYINKHYEPIFGTLPQKVQNFLNTIQQLFKHDKLEENKQLGWNSIVDSKLWEKRLNIFIRILLQFNNEINLKEAENLTIQSLEDALKNINKEVSKTFQLLNNGLKSNEIIKIKWCFKVIKQYYEFENLMNKQLQDAGQSKIFDLMKQNQEQKHFIQGVLRQFSDMRRSFLDIDFKNLDDNLIEADRKIIYELAQKVYVARSEIQEIALNLTSNAQEFNKLPEELQNHLDQGIIFLQIQAQNILGQKSVAEEDWKKFNNVYKQTSFITKYLLVARQDITLNLDKIIIDKYQNIVQQAKLQVDNQKLAPLLVELKMFSHQMIDFKKRAEEQMNIILKDFQSRNKNSINPLGLVLDKDYGTYGKLITSDCKVFEGFAMSLRNQKIVRKPIEEVIINLTSEGDEIDEQKKNKLMKLYKEFDQEYQILKEQYLRKDPDLAKLASEAKISIVRAVKKIKTTQMYGYNIDNAVKQQIPKLMAHIFAYWTVKNSNHFFEQEEQSGQDQNYLLLPHPAQILSIFRILFLDQPKFQNNLVQIGTGEGKSITLGVTSTILALLGFEVNCACYSSYLSSRDYDAFSYIFDAFGVKDQIFYGTFNQLCERVINEKQDIRQAVEQVLKLGSCSQASLEKKIRPKILLIDEVDVFFSQDFFGQTYNPICRFTTPEIDSLIDYIWSKRQSSLPLEQLKKTPQYQSCLPGINQGYHFIFDEAVKDLVYDSKNFAHEYTLYQGQYIGYKQQDQISIKVSYGYKTMFAYMHEIEKGSIKVPKSYGYKYLNINCGNYSYADIPAIFAYKLGVSGTLKCLTSQERTEIIEKKYDIKIFTYSPSVFGKYNVSYNERFDIKIFPKGDVYNKITENIRSKIKGRAILIFFETIKELMEFRNSQEFQPFLSQSQYITEEATNQEKEIAIKNATTISTITLSTQSFGRGTDFILRDQNLNLNGGLHLIQTFYSDTISEEVQIKGRVARQGDNGSYCMILNYDQLQKFYLTEYKVRSVQEQEYYQLLEEKRNTIQNEEFVNRIQSILDCQKVHQSSMEFLLSLQSNDTKKISEYLRENNKGQEVKEAVRVLIALDCTGSMSSTLNNCKMKIGEMFDRASDILVLNSIPASDFEIQFCAYRNYGCQEQYLLEVSPWDSKPSNLKNFLTRIDCRGGEGHEAIEVAFQYANLENDQRKIAQVILIGDIGPNSTQEVNEKRSRSGGEGYWSRTKFSAITDSQKEINTFTQNKIKVNAFYVAEGAKSEFNKIAQLTGGKCEKLEQNLLTDLVTTSILKEVGDRDGRGDQLVNSYKLKYSSH